MRTVNIFLQLVENVNKHTKNNIKYEAKLLCHSEERKNNNKEKEGNENRPIKIWKGNNLVD